MSLWSLAKKTVAVGTLSSAAAIGYAAWEARQFTLRGVQMPLLPSGARPVRVLHLSDIHLVPGQEAKQEWLRTLAYLKPDLVINTGDNLGHRDSVPLVLDALGGLLARPGVFVLGSNDYYEPSMRNPIAYLLPDSGRRHVDGPTLPWPKLTQAFEDSGWVDLTNKRQVVKVRDLAFAFAGVDDPHLGFDNLVAVSGPADAAADARFGVAHAPYLRVLDQFAHDGYDAIIAGHTHGGQVCLPGVGALTTNCDLEPARAKGLHRHPADSKDGDPGSAWLHVSAGVGTNPYVRLRVACRPEATLIELLPRPEAP